jgi:RNA polymerase sigma factor (sigma-70 family)
VALFENHLQNNKEEMFPYSKDYNEEEDKDLVGLAIGGSTDAISKLVDRHQQFIFHLALKLVRDEDDAADLTQEVLIKMITRLMQFQSKSSFRTWLYRIVMNHFLTSKRNKAELLVNSFDEYGEFLDNVHNDEEMSIAEQQQYSSQIDFVRNNCMSSALLCLDRQQRMVLILGSIFNLRSNVAAEILEMSQENFRKQLSRAKADLFQFMDNKCGLINPDNPCRCHKKTKGMIKAGLVSPETNQFYDSVRESITSVAGQKNEQLNFLLEHRYFDLFTSEPYRKIKDKQSIATRILEDPMVKELFHLN